MCHCAIANFVVSRFPKESDTRKQWGFVVKRVTTDNKAWVPALYDVVCQRHVIVYGYRPIKPFGE